jgi:hypothetical protein
LEEALDLSYDRLLMNDDDFVSVSEGGVPLCTFTGTITMRQISAFSSEISYYWCCTA